MGTPNLGTKKNAKVQKTLAFFVFSFQYGFPKSSLVRLHPNILPDSPEIQPDSGDFFMKQYQAPIPVHGLLRLPQVLSMIPISKSAWWEGCRTGRYPKPVKLGPRTTVWRAEDIAAFIESRGSQGENHE